MLGVGEGIAVLGVCGTVMVGIMKWTPSRQPTNGHTPVTRDMCTIIHGHLDREFKDMKSRQQRMEAGITKLLIHEGIEEPVIE
jgi:hypothetical protein